MKKPIVREYGLIKTGVEIPEELHSRLKDASEVTNMTMRDLILKAIAKHLEEIDRGDFSGGVVRDWATHSKDWLSRIESGIKKPKWGKRGTALCPPFPEIAKAMNKGDSILVNLQDAASLRAALYKIGFSSSTRIEGNFIRVWRN